MTFQSNEERFEKARELARIKEENDLAEHRLKYAKTGGDHSDKRSCYNCEFFNHNDRCTNKAATLMGMMLERDRLRFDVGLCGPDGVFFAPDPKPAIKRRKNRNGVIIGVVSVIALLSLSVFFLGLEGTALLIGGLFLLTLFGLVTG